MQGRMAQWRGTGPTLVLAPALLILPLLAVLAPLGLAPLFLVTAAGSALLAWPRLRLPPRFPLACLCVLVLWGLLGSLWAVDPAYSAVRALRLAAEVTSGIALWAVVSALDESERDRTNLGLLIGMGLGMALLLVEAATGGPLAGLRRTDPAAIEIYKRGASVIALLAWPAAAVLFRRWGLAAALGGLALAGLTVLAHRSDSALLAFCVGAAAFALATLTPRLTIRGFGLLLAAALVIAPLLPPTLLAPQRLLDAGVSLPMSMMHRLVIWKFVAESIPDHLAGGAGLDSARSYPGGRAHVTIEAIDRHTRQHSTAVLEQIPLHPHNAPLQIWLELGIPGILLALGLVGWMVLRLGGLQGVDRFTLAAAIAAFAGAVVVASLSYGLWQSWWIATLWLLSTVTALQLGSPRRSAKPTP
jgi:O-antigen ligase